MPDIFTLPTDRLHRPGQETSRKALEKSTQSRASRTSAVYEVLKSYGHKGAIPEELSIYMGEELIDVRRCFSVLKKKHLIEWTSEERKNHKDNWCQVYRVLPPHSYTNA